MQYDPGHVSRWLITNQTPDVRSHENVVHRQRMRQRAAQDTGCRQHNSLKDSNGDATQTENTYIQGCQPQHDTLGAYINMADNEANGDSVDPDEDQQEKAQKKVAKYDSEAADLERVTDYAEEKEIFSADLSGAMTIIGDRRNKEAAEKMAKERELLKVSIKKEDVDLMVQEMEISRTLAEHKLREHHGNVVAALTTLTD